MLEYRLNSTPLWIDESTSVVIENYNPACNLKDLQNCAGLGIDIPVNEHNRALLGSPERFEKLIDVSERKFSGFEIRYDGALLISGTLIIEEANDDNYSGWVQSNLGALGEEQQDKFINEMDWPSGVSFSDKESYDDNTDDYGIQEIHNPYWWDGKGKEQENPGTDNTTNLLSQRMWDNYFGIANSYDLDNLKEGCVISPFLHLRYVIRQSLKLNKFFIDRNDMINSEGDYSHSSLKNIMVYNNFNILDFVPELVEEQIDTWNYDKQIMESEPVNMIPSGKFNWKLAPFSYADLLPRKTYKEFLIGFQNSLNYILHFRFDGYVNIIDRNAIPTRTPIDLAPYFIGSWKLGTQKNVRLKFIAETDDDDANFSDGFEDLSDRWEDFADAVANPDDLNAIENPAFGELRLVELNNQVYEYGWHVFTSQNSVRLEKQFDTIGWKAVSNGPQPYVYGNADQQEEIKTSISTLQRYTIKIFAATFYKYGAKQKGNLSKMRNLWNNFSLRLISPDIMSGYRSLYWEGESGLFNQRWKTWADFWKTRLPVSADFQLPMNMFTHLQNNITEPFRTKKGNFIIEKTETEFGMHQVGPTKITGFKL